MSDSPPILPYDSHPQWDAPDPREEFARMARAQSLRRLKRLLHTNLVRIERGQVFQYPLRKRPLAIVARAVRATNPDAVIVNDAGDDVFARALDVLLASR